jgi:hypothetical protein
MSAPGPLAAAAGFALVVVGLLVGTYWLSALGGLLARATIAGWLWPRGPEEEQAT